MRGAGSVAIVTTDGGGADRSALATVRALGAERHRVIIANSGRHSLAAASRFASQEVQVPEPGHQDFAPALDRLKRAHGASSLFATSDRALITLDPELARLVDKRRLEALARAAGLSMPQTVDCASAGDLRSAAEDIGYPVIVKPHVKTPGGPVAVRIDSREKLEDAALTEGLVQPLSPGGMQAIAGVMWKGRLVAVVQQRYVRTFPVDAGTASFAVTCSENGEMIDRVRQLLSGFDGIFQAQFVGEHLIDLNPRPYGSMALATAAGVNLPHILCRLRAGDELSPRHAATGVSYRWIDGDYRSLAASVRSGRKGIWSAIGAALPKRGTTHSVASLTDPRPFAVRMWRLVDRLHD